MHKVNTKKKGIKEQDISAIINSTQLCDEIFDYNYFEFK